MFGKKMRFIIVSLVLLSLLSACGKEAPDVKPGANQDPITLKVYFRYAGSLSDEEFKLLFTDPVKKKYPNITMQLVPFEKGMDENQLVVSGEFPDLIFTSGPYLGRFKDLGLLTDLKTLAKGGQLDIAKFDPEAIRQIQAYGMDKQLLALPLSMNFSLLYYNKDIFDQMGVSYPKDDMTWEQTLELAKKLYKPGSDQKYYALDAGDITQHASSLSLPVVNAATGQAALVTDGWRKVLELYKDIKTMPGNQLKGKGNTTFIQEHTLAMFAGYSGPFTSLAGSTDVNWDMVTYPYFSGAKPVAMEVESHPLAISKSSKHPQEAFNVISLLTAQEAQVAMTQRGRLSSLKDETVMKQFAASFPALKNKNVQAVFKHSPAPIAPFSLYDDIVSTELKKAADDYVKGGADVNTILRKSEETANQKIAAEKTGK